MLARIASAAFGQPSIIVWDLATISVVGGALGSLLVLMITLAVSVLSYRRGWDLDAVATPMVTALGDMTTLPSLFLATFLVRIDAIATVAAVVSIGVAIYAGIRAYTVADAAIRRIVLEMTATILLTPILDILAGTVLYARQGQLNAVPVLLAMIPPFVSQAGALGGIFSSRITSKLQIGVITARGRPEAPAFVDAGIVGILAFVVFAVIGVASWALGLAFPELDPVPSLGSLLGGTMLAGLIVTPITIVASYYLAIVTSRFGLDPDNQWVPIITSVMDLPASPSSCSL